LPEGFKPQPMVPKAILNLRRKAQKTPLESYFTHFRRSLQAYASTPQKVPTVAEPPRVARKIPRLPIASKESVGATRHPLFILDSAV